MPAKRSLVIMARYPQLGKVKTRLATEIGAANTYSLYVAFLKDLAERFARGPARLFWAYTPARARFASLPWIVGETFPQEGRNLGERIRNAIRKSRQLGFSQVVVIGSDSPHIRRCWVQKAFAALNHNDLVLGPADDGGYYLVGAGQCPDIFRGISWSTSQVLAQSLDRARSLGLKTKLMARTFDVDQQPDLARLRAVARAHPAELPHTISALKSLGLSL